MSNFRHILESCHLSTNHLPHQEQLKFEFQPLYDDEQLQQFWSRKRSQSVQKPVEKLGLSESVERLISESAEIVQSNLTIKSDIDRMIEELCNRSGLTTIEWDSNWNSNQFRSCLTTLNRLFDQLLSPGPGSLLIRASLASQKLRFIQSSCFVSCDGWLNIGVRDVTEEWIKLIQSIRFQPVNERELEEKLSIILGGADIFGPSNASLVQYVACMKIMITRLKAKPLSKYGDCGYVSMKNVSVTLQDQLTSLHLSNNGIINIPHNVQIDLLARFLRQNVPMAKSLQLEHRKMSEEIETRKEIVQNKLQLSSLDFDCDLPLENVIASLRRMEFELIGQWEIFKNQQIYISKNYGVRNDGKITIPHDWINS